MLEIVPRIFLFGLQEHVAVGDLLRAVAAVEIQIIDAVDALHIHREPFEAVSELTRHRRTFETGDLLEVGELADFHSVAPAFPAEPPGAERRAFPVVLDEADVMQPGIDADGGERLQIEILDVVRRRLQDHLELIIMLQAVRVLAVAAILRTPRGLHIGRVPWLGSERPQSRRRMERAGADFHVIGLQDHAAIIRPETLQRQDQTLERPLGPHMRGRAGLGHRAESFRFHGETRAEPKGPESGGQGADSPCFLSHRKEAAAKIRKRDFDAEVQNVRI